MSRLAFQFFLACLFIFLCFESKAETIVVTSNADAGTGTFREALTRAAANGITDKDYIHFNLPDQSEAGRTITLLSQLPDVSSNLDIDGATQAGNVFGRSTAKVQLLMNYTLQSAYYLGLVVADVEDVGIYGLYIRNVKPASATSVWSHHQGLVLRSVKNVNIGAQGKGNVISGFLEDVTLNLHLAPGGIRYYAENINLKANIIGYEADGTTKSVISASRLTLHYAYGNVNIGGSEHEGNVIANGFMILQANYQVNTSPIYSMPAIINIRNNKVGIDITGVQNSNQAGVGVTSSVTGGHNTITISDNEIFATTDAISISGNSSSRTTMIVKNYIGVDKTLTKRYLGINRGIHVFYTDGVAIGSDDLNDANYISNCKPVYIDGNSSASVNKNSFFCTINAYPMIFGTLNPSSSRPIPRISISSISSNSVTGTATPNSLIELFYSDLCGTCSPETHFADIMSDVNGNWTFNGPLAGGIIASATLNGITSEFTRTRIDITGIRVTNTCGNTGSIIGALPVSAQYVQWLDESDNIVGTGKDLLNVPPGRYKLKALNGDCSETTPWYDVRKSMEVNTSNVQVTSAACGIGGSIRGVQLTNRTTGLIFNSWKNAMGVEVGTALILTNVPAGTYTLTLRTADNSCTETHGPFTVTNVSGPNINISSLSITPANCGTNSGTITGIIATGNGTITYSWKNANNVQVSASRDLINQPPGRYTLEVTDQSSCGAISTSPITILEGNAITINDARKQVFNPTCVGNNGSIKDLEIVGATSVVWKNSLGQVVGTLADLEAMTPGSYRLTASNQFCTKTYDVNLSAQPNLISYGGITKTLTDASCGLNNGKIVVAFQNVVRLPKHYRWEDATGRTIGGNTNVLENVDAGTYRIYGIDDNDCEIYLTTYSINRQPQLAFRTSNHRIVDDNCNQRLGSITGVQIIGGLAPYTYKWINEAGTQVGNGIDVRNLPRGNYRLEVTDALNCVPLTSSFVINNQTQQVIAPTVTPIQLCAPGEATLRVNGTANATDFVLYASETATVPIEVSSNGVFKINAGADKTYFVAQRIGNCESAKVEVEITVGLSGLTIANTITPNNDGINDAWNLKGIENYPKAHIQIFNRTGHKVYESFGYKTPFDGSYKGTVLPAGVYYYMIRLDVACELVTGTLTLIR